MKFKRFKNISLSLFLIFTLLVAVSCGDKKQKDLTVKADLLAKAKKEKAFSGVRFTVKNGVVTLNGVCATDKAKSTVEKTVEGVYGVKSVVSNLVIAPVVIGTDEQLKESVDSVLQEYPAVEAIVTDSSVSLQGQVEGKEAQKLLTSIEELKPKRVENKTVIE